LASYAFSECDRSCGWVRRHSYMSSLPSGSISTAKYLVAPWTHDTWSFRHNRMPVRGANRYPSVASFDKLRVKFAEFTVYGSSALRRAQADPPVGTICSLGLFGGDLKLFSRHAIVRMIRLR
jgi:hypothetical protein